MKTKKLMYETKRGTSRGEWQRVNCTTVSQTYNAGFT